jgi:hypothetical protein
VVHASERLVQEDHRRVGGEPDRDSERAEVAVREVARNLVGIGREAQEGEDLVGRTAKSGLVGPSLP